MTLVLYTTEEAATILRVRQSWLQRQAAARKIPFTMLGGCYRFTAIHLATIVQIFEKEPGSAATSSKTDPVPIGRGRGLRRPERPCSSIAPLRARPRGEHRSQRYVA